MEGGALFGQGQYGCIYDPPLLCEKSLERRRKEVKHQRLLGKITEATDYYVEKEASERIKKIPNNERYFLAIDAETACIPKAMEDQKDLDIWKCDFFARPTVQYDLNKTVHYTMKYGGVDSYKFVCNPKTYNKCETKDYYKNWLTFFEHMLEIGAVMTLHALVHYDIHYSNILIDPKTMLPRLIDFGQAFTADTITQGTLDDRWKMVKADQRVSATEPPEVMMITYMRNRFTAPQSFAQLMKYKDPLLKMESVLGLSRQQEGRDFVKFWRESGIVRRKDWVSLFKTYWPVFDSWSIGAVLLHLFEYCQMMPQIANSQEFKSVRPRMKEVLRSLLRLNPKRRFDCVEALNMWNSENEVVLSERGQAWLEEREKQRKA